MDKILKMKLEAKIQETIQQKNEIKKLCSITNIEDSKSFVLGIMVGRLFNSFYYQSKKILGREPTEIELAEFITMIESKKSDFENLG
jgi:hypothetical protein